MPGAGDPAAGRLAILKITVDIVLRLVRIGHGVSVVDDSMILYDRSEERREES